MAIILIPALKAIQKTRIPKCRPKVSQQRLRQLIRGLKNRKKVQRRFDRARLAHLLKYAPYLKVQINAFAKRYKLGKIK
jgi:hypothetical protein